MMDVRPLIGCLLLVGSLLSTPAAAAWTAGNADVAAAAGDPRISGALAAVDEIDQAAVSDDHAALPGCSPTIWR